METSIFEAKQHLSELVSRVERGERILITRHGKPSAMLVPVPARADARKQSIALLRAARKGRTLGKLTLRALIAEGRK